MERALCEAAPIRITIDNSNYKRIFQVKTPLNHVKLFSFSQPTFHFFVDASSLVSESHEFIIILHCNGTATNAN